MNFYEQNEYLSFKDIANRVPFSEKQALSNYLSLYNAGLSKHYQLRNFCRKGKAATHFLKSGQI